MRMSGIGFSVERISQVSLISEISGDPTPGSRTVPDLDDDRFFFRQLYGDRCRRNFDHDLIIDNVDFHLTPLPSEQS